MTPTTATPLDAIGPAGPAHRAPTTRSYDLARRVWNGSIDRRPALIVRCAGSPMCWPRSGTPGQTGLPVAVRSGGHSFPGLSVADGALVIDLSLMKGLRVDPDARVARVQAGVLLGELDRETQAFGLAVPSGIVTHTGVAGLTLGGGIGWIMRKHGLSIDQLHLRRRRDRHRRVRPGERGRRTRICSGASAAAGATSASSPSSSSAACRWATQVLAGPIFWPMEKSAGGPALLPRLGRRRAGRADDDRHPPQGAAARRSSR